MNDRRRLAVSGASYRASSSRPTSSARNSLETWGMKDAEVLMPIRCPECGEESLEGFPVALVADCLLSGNRIRIRARCHPVEWYATAVEMEQIRQYLGAGCIGPRNTYARYAADVSAHVSIAPMPRSATGSLCRPERPTYTRLARESAAFSSRDRAATVDKFRSRQSSRDAVTPLAKVLSTLRRLWVFDLVFLRRGR
jgi:hypothetical protein